MAAEIVHDNDVALLEDRDQLLLDIGAKALAVDRAIEHAGCRQLATAQCTEECQGSPVTMRRKRLQTSALRTPAPDGRHVGFDPGLVDEDQPFRIEMVLQGLPPLSPASDVGAGLFKGEQRFF